VQFEEVQIPAEFIGKNYEQDSEYRLAFQAWINRLWEDKDDGGLWIFQGVHPDGWF